MRYAFSAPTLDVGTRNVVLYMQGDGRFSPSWSFEEVTDEQTGAKSTVLRVRDMPVFRSGSFKDSMGELTNWESIHIEEMVSHFNLLRSSDIFSDVPVREGHGSFFGDPMTGLVGYHDSLRTQDAVAPDGNTYRYLLASFTLFDQKDQEAFISGKWRNRSSEVGMYETNDGTSYFPVYQGFAFVDIPAVQYLNLFGKEKQRSFSVLLERDFDMSGTATTPPAPATLNPDGSAAPGGETPPEAPATTPENPAPPTQPAPTPQNAPVAPPVAPMPVPAVTPAPVVPEGQHANGGTALQFTCGGNTVSDFAAVQSYISGLETEASALRTFRNDALIAGRKNFVQKLADDKKIVAGQVAELQAVALSLNDDQFLKWSTAYAAMPINPLFANHGGSEQDPTNVDGLSDDEREYNSNKQIVDWHKLGHTMSDSDLRELVAYKRYVELGTKLGKDIS